MLRTIRRLAFHEVAYEPWLGAHCDIDKQVRRFERLIKLSVVEDFKKIGGRFRGREAFAAILTRWQRVSELLLLADCEAMREFAEMAPSHLRYFLLVCIRACAKALNENNMYQYDLWITDIVFPLIVNLVL